MKLSKETLKRIIKEELEAAMNEGYKGHIYKYRPHLRPPHPSDRREAPDFSTPDMQMKMEISKILMFDAGLRISDGGLAAKEIVDNLQGKEFKPGFDLADYLTNTLKIPADQVPRVAEKIMAKINK